MDASASASAAPSQATRPRVVLKIGTSSLVREVNREKAVLCLSRIAQIVELTCDIINNHGHDVVIVSSGAVGSGMLVLGLTSRPSMISTKQALAAIGQVHLMGKFEGLFASLDKPCAQVLLSYDNLSDRTQYLNTKNTFEALFSLGVVPIVNENDTVAVHELKFGDNDRLSAMVASLINANWLFLLTDVNGLYTANPSLPGAKFIPLVPNLRHLMMNNGVDVKNKGSSWGTGGMATKMSAAEIATSSGVKTVIMSSQKMNLIVDWLGSKVPTYSDASNNDAAALVTYEKERANFGTLFEAVQNPVKGRKKWIRSLVSRGTLVIDKGAVQAVIRRRSLFPAGVKSIKGEFSIFEPVRLEAMETGEEVGIGLSNYSSEDLKKIMGKSTSQIHSILGHEGPDYAIDSSNMVCEIRTVATISAVDDGAISKSISEAASITVNMQSSSEDDDYGDDENDDQQGKEKQDQSSQEKEKELDHIKEKDTDENNRKRNTNQGGNDSDNQ